MNILHCAMVKSKPCVGVNLGSHTLLVSKENFLNLENDIKSYETLPNLIIFIGIRVNEQKQVSLYSYGLYIFDKREIEIKDSSIHIDETYNLASNIISYKLDRDVALNDGDTIGYSADHKLELKVYNGSTFCKMIH